MNDSLNEHTSIPKPEQETSTPDFITLFTEQSVLKQYPEYPQIAEASAALTNALLNHEEVSQETLRAAWIEYSQIIENCIDSIEENPAEPKARAKAQIAALINKASIFQVSGQTLRYLNELDTARVQAHNEGFDSLRDSIDDEINNKIEKLELSPEVLILKLSGIIEDADREYLKDLVNDGADLNDIIGDIYGMINDEDQDPDEVLTKLGIFET